MQQRAPEAIAQASGVSVHRHGRFWSLMLTRLVHWIVAIALVLQLASCLFSGVSYMPGSPW
jgi:hypothetical protein